MIIDGLRRDANMSVDNIVHQLFNHRYYTHDDGN